MMDINLAQRAYDGELTVEEINGATKEKLENDKLYGSTLLCNATYKCPIEVVEAILDKNVNIDVQSGYVSLLVVLIIKL
jgi:hypothetical protein